MTNIYPSYYKDFQCTGSDCSDNCCIGWEIDIDEQTLARYEEVDKTTNLSLMKHIDTSSDAPHFILRENGRCPFLDDRNLCRIYASLGEKALCRICSLHPRFINTYDSTTEYGLDLCCEEAARIILTQQTYPSYGTCCKPDKGTALFDTLTVCRHHIFEWIHRDKTPLSTLKSHLLTYALALDDLLFDADFDAMQSLYPDAFVPDSSQIPSGLCSLEEKTLKHCLDFLCSLIPLSVSWHNFLADVTCDLKEILSQKKMFQTVYPDFDIQSRLLLEHYIYHYFLTSLWENETYSKVFLAVFMVSMIELFDLALVYYNKTFSLQDQITICCQFSKELEYCEENLEQLLNFSYEIP